jgi:hypothetical protein
MPQLDKFAFAPQVFWLVLVFLALYLLILRDGLSVLYRVLSFRKRSIQLLSTRVTTFIVETSALQSLVSRVLVAFLTNRLVSDSLIKMVELFTTRSSLQFALLNEVRTGFTTRLCNTAFVGAKQGLLPLAKDFSSLKVLV